GAHLVGIVLVAVFPIGIVIAVAVAQEAQDLCDVAILHYPAQPYRARIGAGNSDLQATCLDLEFVAALDRRTNGAAGNLLDHAYAMIGIDDLVADLENRVVRRRGHKGNPSRGPR